MPINKDRCGHTVQLLDASESQSKRRELCSSRTKTEYYCLGKSYKTVMSAFKSQTKHNLEIT